MNIKKLSDELHQRVLGYKPTPWTRRAKVDAIANLSKFDLQDAVDRSDEIELPLPSWAGTYQEEMAKAVSKYGTPYIDMLDASVSVALPDIPYRYKPKTGWQRCAFGAAWEASEPPTSDKAMVLDFETVETPRGWLPTCCVVVTDSAWYVWLNDLTDINTMVSVAPFSNGQMVIGHNVAYDRALLASEYPIADSGNRFLDTMSAWIAARGFTNQQRAIFAMSEKDEDFLAPAWTQETGKNGLDDVYKFYTGKELDKGVRDSIVDLGWMWVRDNMDEVVKYAFRDVLATLEVFQHVYPELRQSQPSDIALTGQLLLGNTWLPLSVDRWSGYYDKAEAKYREVEDRTEAKLWVVVEQVLAAPSEYQKAALDWTAAKTGKNKGLPKWYRDLLPKRDKAGIAGTRVAAILLGCTWKGEVVKWCTDEESKESGWFTDGFGWLPHPEKRGKKLTDLFMQKMLKTVEDGILDAPGGVKDLLLDLISVVNWVSLRKRVKGIHTEQLEGFPVVLPQIVVTGTITRRCKDNVWQVASNPKKARIGTELKSMVEAPKGYRFVGADVDSQELWIAACYGDSVLGYCGSTPLGLMILVGTKEDKTDPHSVLANQVAVNRDTAKVLNYGMVYGQGLKGTMDVLLKENPLMTVAEAETTATELLKVFKGSRLESRRYIHGLASDSFNEMEKIANAKCPTTPILGTKISAALRGIKDFQTTRVNWTVQSAGVDFRDIWVTFLRHFYDKLKIDGRLLTTIHDEARTIVREDHVKRAVYACQLAHLYTRAYFIDAFNLDCIPSGIAYHSAVDVDTVLRKNPKDPQLTPSQTTPIAPGYEVKARDVLGWFSIDAEDETKVAA